MLIENIILYARIIRGWVKGVVIVGDAIFLKALSTSELITRMGHVVVGIMIRFMVVCSVHFAVCSVHSTLLSVHCAGRSAQCRV